MSDEPLLRQATAADLEAAAELLRQSDGDHAAMRPEVFVPSPEGERREALRREGLHGAAGAAFVAEVGGRVVGLIELDLVARPARVGRRAERYVMVNDLVVARDHRGAGLGRRLMATADEWAAAQGIDEVRLHVWEANGPARRLYDELGYETLGRILRRRRA